MSLETHLHPEAAQEIPGSVPLRDFKPRHKRKVLLAFPRYSYSFGTFNHAFPLMGDVKGFMPPQGILVVTAVIPKEWDVKFVDENIARVTREEFEWADVVFISGMHIQRSRIHDLARRAHDAGKVAVLGGPSVSSAPEYYPDFDYLHCGELGDATLRLFQRIDETIERPEQQILYRTVERLPMAEFPTPAYDRIKVRDYLLGSVQFSSGCPYTCEFCDIPSLYGRNPRLKTPEQVVKELDMLADGGAVSVYFVDDNFIGNPKAADALLDALIAWQQRPDRDYLVRLACEATLNMAAHTKILEKMQLAGFNNCFFGIETPDPKALKAMKKGQNMRMPILEAVQTVNKYGIEAASGIIMGLDTDTDETPQALMDFADVSQIPIMTVNILYALPNTALYARLEKDNRVLPAEKAENRDSNIVFLRPYEKVVKDWQKVIGHVFNAENLYARYAYNAQHVYPHRIKPKNPAAQATWSNISRALGIFRRILWRVGVCADYRKLFWKMMWHELKQGNIETIFQVAMVAHHLITYSRECTEGKMQSSNYSIRRVEEERESEALAAALVGRSMPPITKFEFYCLAWIADGLNNIQNIQEALMRNGGMDANERDILDALIKLAEAKLAQAFLWDVANQLCQNGILIGRSVQISVHPLVWDYSRRNQSLKRKPKRKARMVGWRSALGSHRCAKTRTRTIFPSGA